jgi:molybdate transport system permease protein
MGGILIGAPLMGYERRGAGPDDSLTEAFLPTDTALLVLAAASLTDVLPQVARAWAASGGGQVEFSFDATSRLAPQAAQGAPADILFSADQEWMDWVEARGALEEGTRATFLTNDLVLVIPRMDPDEGGFVPTSPSELLDARVVRLALAGENVPAGRYAYSALRAEGVWTAVEPKVVRSGSVRGALEWAALGEVQAAVVYRTDALVEDRVRITYRFPPTTHPPISYPGAVLKGARFPEAAGRFLDFCRSPEGAAIFQASGFSTGSPPSGGQVGSTRREPPEERVGFPDPWSAIRLSFWVALAATLVGFVPAVGVGWLLARRDFPGKSILATVILAPLVLPPVVTGFLLLSLLGSRGPMGGWLGQVGISVPFTLVGATLAAFTVGLPLYVVSVRNAFQTVDPSLEEVSWTLGRKPFPTFLKVAFPLALPGIAAGSVLAFARALGEFGATVVLAGNIEGSTRTIALAVYTLLESPEGRETIWVLVGASVVLSLLALLGYEALSRRQRRQMETRRVR